MKKTMILLSAVILAFFVGCNNPAGESTTYYTLSFDGNNAASGDVPEAVKQAAGSIVELPGNTGSLALSGYYFAGWNTEADGSGTSYSEGAEFTFTADATLYAQWSETLYTLTYNANGAESGTVPSSVQRAENGTVSLPDNTGMLALSGYSFVGWNTAADGSGTSYEAGSTYAFSTSDVILYAEWEKIYTLTYNGNNADSGTVPNAETGFFGDTITLPDNTGTLVLDGYYFTGWNTSADGDGDSYSVGDTFTFGTEDETLYAEWTLDAFTLVWETDDQDATLMFNGTGTIYVDWGDGSDTETITNPSNPSHSYDTDDAYIIRVTGDVDLWNYTVSNEMTMEREEITNILHWGPFSFANESSFSDCSSLTTVTPDDVPDFKEGSTCNYSFENCTSLTGINNISDWDVSCVSDMSFMFYCAIVFNQDISDWNVSNISDMSAMFYAAYAFNQDISDWDVSNVTDMSNMFNQATAFNQDISNWDVSNVADMSYMFSQATAFNQDISDLDVSSVTNMSYMFNQASVFNQDLSDWDVSSVTNMGYMFNEASAFNQDISDWNVSSVTDMNHMFCKATVFNQDLPDWDVSSVSNMYYMFSYAKAFNGDICDWDVSTVKSMSYMFFGATTFNQDISDWDVSNVVYMSSMFYVASSFNQDLEDWDVNASYTGNMFTRSGLAGNEPSWYSE